MQITLKTLLAPFVVLLMLLVCSKSPSSSDSTNLQNGSADMNLAFDPGGNVPTQRALNGFNYNYVNPSYNGQNFGYGYQPFNFGSLPNNYYSYNSPFGSQISQAPYYGVNGSPFMNYYLGYSDYFHYASPSLTSVVRIKIGSANGVYNPNGNLFGIDPTSCQSWNLTFSSNQPLNQLNFSDPSSASQISLTQVTPNSVNLQWSQGNWNTAGFYLGLTGQQLSGCSNSPTAPWGTNPYANNYQGNYNGLSYYFPPPVCPAQYMPTSLQVSGTLTNCNGGQGTYAVSQDLSSVTQAMAQTQAALYAIGPNSLIQVRGVNYNGADFYNNTTPVNYANNYIYPSNGF